MWAHDPRSAQDMSTCHNLCSPESCFELVLPWLFTYSRNIQKNLCRFFGGRVVKEKARGIFARKLEKGIKHTRHVKLWGNFSSGFVVSFFFVWAWFSEHFDDLFFPPFPQRIIMVNCKARLVLFCLNLILSAFSWITFSATSSKNDYDELQGTLILCTFENYFFLHFLKE